jgi:hypothetical protein
VVFLFEKPEASCGSRGCKSVPSLEANLRLLWKHIFFPFSRSTAMVLAEVNPYLHEKQLCAYYESTFFFKKHSCASLKKQICASTRNKYVSLVKAHIFFSGSIVVLLVDVNMCLHGKESLFLVEAHFFFRNSIWLPGAHAPGPKNKFSNLKKIKIGIVCDLSHIQMLPANFEAKRLSILARENKKQIEDQMSP